MAIRETSSTMRISSVPVSSVWAVLAVLLAVATALGPVCFSNPQQRTLRHAVQALNARDFHESERLANIVLESHSQSHLALLIAGSSAAGRHEHQRAIDYYKKIPKDAGELGIRAQMGLGERWVLLGNIERAEQCFQFVLKKWPDNFLANKRYAYLMQVQGRSWESVDPAMRMIRQGLFGATEIHIVGCPENRFLLDQRFLELCETKCPEDFRPLLSKARLAVLHNEMTSAESLLETVVARNVDVVSPYAQLGRIYLESGRDADYIAIENRLPDGANANSRIWLNRGLWALRQHQVKAAGRCFFEVLERTPHHVEANYLMSQVLVQLGKPELAGNIGKRAKILARIELSIPEFYDEPTQERMQGLIRDFVSLDRIWEAAAVCDFARRFHLVTPDWAKSGLTRFGRSLRASDAALFPDHALEELEFLKEYSLPDISTSTVASRNLADPHHSRAPIRFEDQASEVGLDFTYFNGSLSTRGMEHIFETTGGGTVALDFDQDQWTDLYFTQGAAIWEGDDAVKRIDKLFRNDGENFIDVTTAAGLGDADFGQGATAGDYNNDGFVDIYVCNLTGNRFYENNGDGTFTEITKATNTAGDEWSLSCVLADLNGDSLQDLYVVNYLQRQSVFDHRCKRNGQPLTCAPTMFPAEQDRLYLNSGDGSFHEVTDESGIVQPEGKGLAIQVADFDRSGKLSLFLGNDTAPNFFFLNRTQNKDNIKFEEAGLISGLALGGTGRSQATMGIAFGDIDGSGDGDLFVTNFYNDSNTLYQQQSPGQFLDVTRQVNLREASLPMLGFGTEFIDADNDGELDLFITNGHVDRTYATGEPDEMPPQFFENTGNGSFELITSPDLGPYFAGKYLGRSVSRLDWNRDGRDDLCVLHLYSPVALVTNETESENHYVRIHLRGTQCARDAIGTTVELQSGEQKWVHQLVAGDGYMTGNERVLTFGLGEKTKIDRITVQWIDGAKQTFSDIKIDQESLLIQGAEIPMELEKH